MDLKEAVAIVQDLADGLDPFTGESLPVDGPYQSPRVVRALETRLQNLRHPAPPPDGEDGRPVSAGLPWTTAEDGRLADEFGSGLGVAEMAGRHGRTRGAITSRLVRLGLVEDRRPPEGV